MRFKPLLAYTVEDMKDTIFPVVASPKLDGIRCLIVGGEAVTRTLKPIPNAYIRDSLRGLPAFDGELIIGNPVSPTAFNASTSGVMSHDGEPDFTYHVFDVYGGEPFADRYKKIDPLLTSRCAKVDHRLISSLVELIEYEEECVVAGYEGIMVRDPLGLYKHGRSTKRDRILGKVKRFYDTEATILSVEELLHNENETVYNALGNAERSTSITGMVPSGTLGSLVAQSPMWDQPFKIGTGYDAETRRILWGEGRSLVGRLVKFKYQPSGTKEAPRFPVFISLREEE